MPYPYLPQPSGNPWVDSQNGGLGMLYGEQALKDNATIEAQRAFELQRAQAGVPLNDAVMANNLAAAKRQAALDTSGETDAQAQLARDAAKSEAQGKILKNLTAAQSAQRDAVYQAAESMSQYHQTAPDASFEEANRYYQTYVRQKLLESGVKQAPPEYNLQASIDLMAQGKAALSDIKQRQQVQRIETKNIGSENVAGIRGAAAKDVAGVKANAPTNDIKNATFVAPNDPAAQQQFVKDIIQSKIDKAAPGKPNDPVVIDYYATQSLAGDNSWQVGLARGKVGQQLIADVKDRIPKMAEEYGITSQEAIANKGELVGQMKAIAQRQVFVSAASQFMRNLNSQIDLVDKYMEPGANNAPSVFNRWIQAGRKQVLGDPDVAKLDLLIRGLGREHQRIVTGVTSNAQLLASANTTADELVNISQTPEQIRAAMGAMREEATNYTQAGEGRNCITQVRYH